MKFLREKVYGVFSDLKIRNLGIMTINPLQIVSIAEAQQHPGYCWVTTSAVSENQEAESYLLKGSLEDLTRDVEDAINA